MRGSRGRVVSADAAGCHSDAAVSIGEARKGYRAVGRERQRGGERYAERKGRKRGIEGWRDIR